MNILIVDDSKISVTIIEKHLGNVEYESIQYAENGEEAFSKYSELLKKSTDDIVILMDINMPKMNGIESIKKIRNLEKENNISIEKRSKIVVVTAYDSESAEHLARLVGANSYCRKPLVTGVLIEALENLDIKINYKK